VDPSTRTAPRRGPSVAPPGGYFFFLTLSLALSVACWPSAEEEGRDEGRALEARGEDARPPLPDHRDPRLLL
jgi:hypothetical protein